MSLEVTLDFRNIPPLAPRRDFLPVLVLMGRGDGSEGRLTRYLDAETGQEIEPMAVDTVTGAKIGTRPIRVVTPE